MQNGWWKYYYENGKIQQEGLFKNGEAQGVWKEYDMRGQLKATKMY